MTGMIRVLQQHHSQRTMRASLAAADEALVAGNDTTADAHDHVTA
jgi:hypothetical protein